MIAYLKGSLEYIGEDFIFIETAGVGYRVQVSPATIARLPVQGSLVRVYTFMNVKEDGISLFGFYEMEELRLFERLITVNGVGPKGALAFLSGLSPKEIILAILSEDLKTLMKAPGVGKKTAQRLILDLKDKLSSDEILPDAADFLVEAGAGGSDKKTAMEALVALGYSQSEATRAVSTVYQEGLGTEELLKLALKKMI